MVRKFSSRFNDSEDFANRPHRSKTNGSNWREHTGRNPCPKCGRASWCTTSKDGGTLLCHTPPDRNSRDPRFGLPKLMHTDGGDVWRYILDPTIRPSLVSFLATDQATEIFEDFQPTLDRYFRRLPKDLDLENVRLTWARELGLPRSAAKCYPALCYLDGRNEYPLSDGVLYSCWLIPSHGDDGTLIGGSRRYFDPSKPIGQWSVKANDGKKSIGSAGLFIPAGVEGMTNNGRPHILHVVEGSSDAAALTAAGRKAIGLPGVNQRVRMAAKWIIANHNGPVFIHLEDDREDESNRDPSKPAKGWPGRRDNLKAAETLANLLDPVRNPVYLCQVPDDHKDARECLTAWVPNAFVPHDRPHSEQRAAEIAFKIAGETFEQRASAAAHRIRPAAVHCPHRTPLRCSTPYRQQFEGRKDSPYAGLRCSALVPCRKWGCEQCHAHQQKYYGERIWRHVLGWTYPHQLDQAGAPAPSRAPDLSKEGGWLVHVGVVDEDRHRSLTRKLQRSGCEFASIATETTFELTIDGYGCLVDVALTGIEDKYKDTRKCDTNSDGGGSHWSTQWDCERTPKTHPSTKREVREFLEDQNRFLAAKHCTIYSPAASAEIRRVLIVVAPPGAAGRLDPELIPATPELGMMLIDGALHGVPSSSEPDSGDPVRLRRVSFSRNWCDDPKDPSMWNLSSRSAFSPTQIRDMTQDLGIGDSKKLSSADVIDSACWSAARCGGELSSFLFSVLIRPSPDGLPPPLMTDVKLQYQTWQKVTHGLPAGDTARIALVAMLTSGDYPPDDARRRLERACDEDAAYERVAIMVREIDDCIRSGELDLRGTFLFDPNDPDQIMGERNRRRREAEANGVPFEETDTGRRRATVRVGRKRGAKAVT